MVTVGCPSFPEVTEGVLLKEGFVTSLEMETKLSKMRDNMSVMEYRMESWLIRIRDLDRAEISNMQQQRALDRSEISNMQQQMSNLQQQRTLDRAEMRAEMRAQMRAFTAELRSGFRNSQKTVATLYRTAKGMRKIAFNHESGITDGDEKEQVKGGDELQQQVTDTDITSAHLYSQYVG